MARNTLIYLGLMTLLHLSLARWEPPYLTPLGTVEDANMTGSTEYDLYIRMDEMSEEMTVPLDLAILHYTGTNILEIEKYSYGNAEYSGLDVEKNENNHWILKTNRIQDYENQYQRLYAFNLKRTTEDNVTITINLAISNVLDTPPLLTYDGPCTARELTPNYNTECHFYASTPEGLQYTNLTVEIGGEYESSLFSLVETDRLSSEIVFTLYVKDVGLNYNERALHNFETFVFDNALNSFALKTIVNVEDIESENPIFVRPFASARFIENEPQEFLVVAIDGDLGLQQPVCYSLEFDPDYDYSSNFTILRETGNISINAIDRDYHQREIFSFSINAFKCHNQTFLTKMESILIVDDDNNNTPEITVEFKSISILENTYLTLPLGAFSVNDRDMGIRASYSVELTRPDETIIDYAQPFLIIPDKGYQESNFMITITDTINLDYEDDDWKQFDIIVKSVEDLNATHSNTERITINLINWNDESPIFDAVNGEYFADVEETIGGNVQFITVQATDRDEGDTIEYEIVGSRDLSIDENGTIATINQDTFDYERQSTVIVQVKATDTLITEHSSRLHTTFAQLTINIIDINDETPEIKMPRKAANVIENSPAGTIVTVEIQGTDLDGTNYLEFSINWDDTYATKNGQEVDQIEYRECFIIERFEFGELNRVNGSLSVNPNFNGLIDYEKVDIIYLIIKVTDLNQEVNEDSAEGVLTVLIEDVNDNPPEFIQDTLMTNRQVIEEARIDTIIGTILAEDIDGPPHNNITYSMVPADDSPNNYLQIDPRTGVITVIIEDISCDSPKLYALNFTITISDGELENRGNITIIIIDTNNQSPIIGEQENPIYIYENFTSGEIVTIISASDLDRDSPHNEIYFAIDHEKTNDQSNTYFEIELNTGAIILKNNMVLNRDGPDNSFSMLINVRDNYLGIGRVNLVPVVQAIILLDVNDNAPTFPSPDLVNINFMENATMGSEYNLQVVDIDEPNTPNSQINCSIVTITSGGGNANPIPDDIDKIFIVRVRENQCYLTVDRNLIGYYGKWIVTFHAHDLAELEERQESTVTYEITIDPCNFRAPIVLFPVTNTRHRFNILFQQVGSQLQLYDNSTLRPFEAEDTDGGIFGDITFEIENMYPTEEFGYDNRSYFLVFKESTKLSQLKSQKVLEPGSYILNVRAIDGGSLTSEWVKNVTFYFSNMEEEPFFVEREQTVGFTENEEGMLESHYIFEAIDPKNDGLEEENHFPIYYYIDDSVDTENAQKFKIDKETRLLTLATELDREEISEYHIRIICSSLTTKPINPDAESILIVHIKVIDVNDNPPIFDSSHYSAGITTEDQNEKIVVTVQATDLDELDEGKLRYRILSNTYYTNDDSLNAVLLSAFAIDEISGAIRLNFRVSSQMTGYIQFEVQVIDTANHTDECTIKIYIISELNRVTFVFMNPKENIEQENAFIIQTFQLHYGYQECNIDEITYHEEDGEIQDRMSSIRVHFINNSEAIEGSVIRAKTYEIGFLAKLRSDLLMEDVNLYAVPNSTVAEEFDNFDRILRILLIVILAMLACLCCVLFGAYFIRTRSLTRQLKALTETNFGSTASNLNRREAPTTNVFSVEGSNPVLNNGASKMVFDRMSIQSEESDEYDFEGINDDPTFIPNSKKESSDTAVISEKPYTISSNDLDRNGKEFGAYRF